MNSCNICYRKFDISQLLQSNQDEFFCKECFKYEYFMNSHSSDKKPISNKCEGDSFARGRKMFSLAELAKIRQDRDRREQVKKLNSKRPLQCPHVDCKKYVSVFDLNAHFQHEHIDVRISQCGFNVRNPLSFYPTDIRYGAKQCLHLLNFIPEDEENNNTNLRKHNGKVVKPLPVTIAILASRISAAHLEDETTECGFEDEEEVFVQNNDKIIVWANSNVLCKYKYTVAASTITGNVRVKYYGPLRQLPSCNTTSELYQEGQCLILSHYQFLGMTDNGLKPLHIDLIIHSLN